MPFSKEILLGSSGQSTGFYNGIATQSLRITSQGYLNHAHTSAPTLDTKGTIAYWIKINNNLDRNYVIQNYQANNNDGLMDIRFGGSNTYDGIHCGQYGRTPYANASGQDSVKQRDFSQWYHFLLSFDSTSGTASERLVKIFINGVQVSKGTFGAISQNDKFPLTAQGSANGGVTIGRHATVGYYLEAYLADFYCIDGQALDPTSFTEIKNGVCIPAEYTGTYGNNGFRLEFKGTGTSADSSGIGADTSGNDNHFSVTTLAAHDSNLPDCPENCFMTFNPNHRADTSLDLRQGNLHAHCDSDDGVFTTIEIPREGKWYVEFVLDHVSKPTGVYIIGNKHETRDDWTHTANYTSSGFGFSIQGSTNNVFEYGGSQIGSTHSAGMIYAFLIDVDNSTYDIYQNDTKILDGATFTYPAAPEGMIIGVGNNSDSGTNNCNFYLNAGQDSSFFGEKTAQGNTDANGIGDFYYDTKGGLALCTSNLPEPTISPNKAEQADDHFGTIIYDGQSTDKTISTNFQADWLWFKERTTDGIQHQLFDSSRLHSTTNNVFGRVLRSDSTAVEADSTAVVSQSGNDIVVDGGVSTVNDIYSRTYVMWHWKANGGTTSSNTDGTTTSTVQVNDKAGFSIVLYSGNSSSRTVGHGLSSAPQFVIIKSRTHTERWTVFHHSIANGYIYLNDTFALQTGNADERFGDSSSVIVPNSTVVTLGANNSDVNKSGEDYVMYCFREIEGYSKFGEYHGNGNADGQFVYTGFRPAWLLGKKHDNTDNWFIFDNVRDTTNHMSRYLLTDSTNDEYDADNSLDFLSNGFKWRINSGLRNNSGNEYIYVAFAEQPFKFSNAR